MLAITVWLSPGIMGPEKLASSLLRRTKKFVASRVMARVKDLAN